MSTNKNENLLNTLRIFDKANKILLFIPNPELIENIYTLKEILCSVINDWEKLTSEYTREFNIASKDSSIEYFLAKAMIELKVPFLKCILSYVLFFSSLDKYYNEAYKQLNKFNGESGFNLKHNKQPKDNDYTKKARKIRDISISHPISTKYTKLNAMSAIIWTPFILNINPVNEVDISKLTFGGFKKIKRDNAGKIIEQSDDLQIKNILELNKHCFSYLNTYESYLYDYLMKIQKYIELNKDSYELQ